MVSDVEAKGKEVKYIKYNEKKSRGLFKKRRLKNNHLLKRIEDFFDVNYKKLMLIPITLFILSLVVLSLNYIRTGEIISRGISLKGGISITLTKSLNLSRSELQHALSHEYPSADIIVREIKSAGGSNSFIIESSISQSELQSFIHSLERIVGKLNKNEYSVETISSSLSERFFAQILKALIWAFVLMGIVVIIYFREMIPAFAVILSAVADIIGTLAFTSLLGFKISTAGVAAFLMLIGYSVDSDILLTTRVMKRRIGTIFERVKGAFHTGILMSLTTITAVGLAFLFSNSDVIRQIMAIILIGLLIDIINTWILNVGILRAYMERRLARKK